MELKCRKCNGHNFIMIKNGSQTGLYCDDCGAWQKWIAKNKLAYYSNLIERLRDKNE